MYTTRKQLPHIVECRHPGQQFYEPIAAFNVNSAARNYAEACAAAHTTRWSYRYRNTLRAVTVFEGLLPAT